jgi:hypothetical protein
MSICSEYEKLTTLLQKPQFTTDRLSFLAKKKCPGCSESFEEGASLPVLWCSQQQMQIFDIGGQKRMKERKRSHLQKFTQSQTPEDRSPAS